MEKKGVQFLSYKVVSLIMVVLVSILLVILVGKMYSIFYKNSELHDAQLELQELKKYIEYVSENGGEKNYSALTSSEWYFFNDEFGNKCNGEHCLCICKLISCDSDLFDCIATKDFVVLRDQEKKERRAVKLESPYKFIVKSIGSDNPVYSFSAKSVEHKTFETLLPSALFFKYENGWKWSADLVSWMDVNESVAQGKWEGVTPNQNNLQIIEELNEINKHENSINEGELLFRNAGAKKSNKLIIVEK